MSTVVIIGHFRLPVESLDAAREPMARVVMATRAEPGCIKYAYASEPGDPGLIHVSEVWESQAALDAHLRSENFLRVLGAIELSSAPPEVTFDYVSATGGMEVIQRARGPDEKAG